MATFSGRTRWMLTALASLPGSSACSGPPGSAEPGTTAATGGSTGSTATTGGGLAGGQGGSLVATGGTSAGGTGPGGEAGQGPAASCEDGMKNGTETDADCGGACPGCVDGLVCQQGSDCMSGACVGGLCKPPSCTDGVKNGLELDVDCGGGACPGCGVGKTCLVPGDCASKLCDLPSLSCAAAASCKAWRDAGNFSDGVYSIDPDGMSGTMASFNVYCDMTTEGGGWTKIYAEYEVLEQSYFLSKTNEALNPDKLLTSPTPAATVAHLSQAQVNAVMATQIWDKLGDGVHFAKFNRGSLPFDFIVRVVQMDDPGGLSFNYPWGNGQTYTSWALNPDRALYLASGGTGFGYLGDFGFRPFGSHGCGTYGNCPTDGVRRAYQTGDYFVGCYACQQVYPMERSIWLR